MLLILALAVTIPMVAGKIDLSIGYGVGLWQVMALSFQLMGLDYRISILLCLVGGAVIGLLNALLVELAQVDAFIATLATGQVIYALTFWHTGGRQITDSTGSGPWPSTSCRAGPSARSPALHPGRRCSASRSGSCWTTCRWAATSTRSARTRGPRS